MDEEVENPQGERAPPTRDAVARLNGATFEELRALGLSVAQAGEVLAYRERTGGFRSVDELDRIPGFATQYLGGFKHELGTDGYDEEFRWANRPSDEASAQARRGRKYLVAFGGRWQARFASLDEAIDYAEAEAPNRDGDIVYVVESNLWRRRLVTAYPQSRLEDARSLWKRWRATGGIGGG
jgi:helix-hairpin-helix protein